MVIEESVVVVVVVVIEGLAAVVDIVMLHIMVISMSQLPEQQVPRLVPFE